jgi:hypothetical protein
MSALLLVAAILVVIVMTPIATAIMAFQSFLFTGWPPLDRWTRELARRLREGE